MRKAFDLSAAAEHLSANSNADGFVKAVHKFHSVVSVTNDLKEAQTSVDALIKMRSDPNPQDHLIRALLMHAVVTYSRAAHTKAVERYDVGVTKAFSKEQKVLHKTIVDLRDKVLAHFGPGDGWHIEKVIYTEQGDQSAIFGVHTRLASDSDVVNTLKELLTVAIPFVEARQAERADELDGVLQEHQEFFAVITRVPFDNVAFYAETPCAEEDFWGPDGFNIDSTIRRPTTARLELPWFKLKH